MKNDLEVPFDDEESTPLSVSVIAAAKKRKTFKKMGEVGEHMTMNVMGTDVHFTLKRVAAESVKSATMVWLKNERDQDLLDEFSVADILETFRTSGQQFPAVGRTDTGIIEVADGSRRRFAAIATEQPFYIWIGDLTDAQMDYLSETGNQYKETSAYEKGHRYQQKLTGGMSQQELADALQMSRKALMRYVYTSRLPIAFIKALPSPNDLSVTLGEQLYKNYKKLSEDDKEALVEHFEILQTEKGQHSSDELIKLFNQHTDEVKPAKPVAEKRELAMGATIKVKGTKATINMPTVSANTLKEIEEFISKKLSEDAVNNC